MHKLLLSLMGATLLTLILVPAGGVNAGPSDDPMPSFSDGQLAQHVYTAVGAIKNNNLETLFVCTNLSTALVNIGLELFDKTGLLRNSLALGNGINLNNGAALNVAVGATVTLATGGTTVITTDVVVAKPPDPPLPAPPAPAISLKNGSARIVATSKLISCTAMLVDDKHEIWDPLFITDPPPTIVNLPLIRIP